MKKKLKLKTSLILICCAISIKCVAESVSVPNVFEANTPAKAEEVNQNFFALETAINDNSRRLDQTDEEALTGIPFRCERFINTPLLEQNIPITCQSPNGEQFVNVPEGRFFYVTDIMVRPNVAPSTNLAASVRIFEARQGGLASETGCDNEGNETIGSFLTSQLITLKDTETTGFEHVKYNTPFLILKPTDCLAVFVLNNPGLELEVTGKLWNKLH